MRTRSLAEKGVLVRDSGYAPAWSFPSRCEARSTTARWAVLVLFFVNGALFATWASRIPGVQSERGLSDGALGLALLVLALGAVIAMPVAGLLIARIGSEKVCKVSALLFCAALPVVMVVPSKPLFFAAL